MSRRKNKSMAGETRERDLQWHLMWCRRRQERAQVLVMRLSDADPGRLRELLGGFRVTDSVEASKVGGKFEIQAVLDERGLSCAGLERRIVEAFGSTGPEFGWASFPEDGVTLEVLLDEARRSLLSGRATTRGASVPLAVVHDLRGQEGRLEPLDA